MSMPRPAKVVYTAALAAHWDALHQSETLRNALRGSGDLGTLCDTIYALKESGKLLEESRKEVDRLVRQLEYEACQLYVMTSDGEPVRTEYCTASPDVKQTVITPKKGTPEYEALCRHFNVDPDGPFAPHWTKMIDHVSAELAAGRPLPPGCDPNKVTAICKVGIRKKRAVLDEGEGLQITTPERLKDVAKVIDSIPGMRELLNEEVTVPGSVSVSEPSIAEEDTPF